jgi:5-methylcytosine-specific restriction enzyme A
MSSASPILTEIKPTCRLLVMDLVRDAGLDVSDWANFRGGKKGAASNPRYCYEWAFVQADKVVLNLWYEEMRAERGRVFRKIIPRKRARAASDSSSTIVRKARAAKFHEAIRTAYMQQLPIQVIVCYGKKRRTSDSEAKASRVQYRLLDPKTWAVASYDWSSGVSTLVRGAKPSVPTSIPVDEELEGFEGTLRKRFVSHRKREAKMRNLKIAEAWRCNKGRLVCEVPNCGFEFLTRYGALGEGYAQVHHKVPLSAAPKEGRKVRLRDLVILCANCHAMIHRHGECHSVEKLIPRI